MEMVLFLLHCAFSSCTWFVQFTISQMPFRNVFLKGKSVVLNNLKESFPPSHIRKTINFSSQTISSSSSWVQNNQLFQRHPRLQLLEGQCNKTIHHFKKLFSYVFVSGLHRNPFVMSRLLYFTLIELEQSKCGIKEKFEYGVEIFNQIRKPNIFSWNTIIRFFAASEKPIIALHYYMKMLRQEMVPDKYTFPFLLQACAANFDLGLVEQVHSQTVQLGLDHDLFVQNSLLNAYINCGSLSDAWLVFDEMPERDVVSWTSLISGLASQSNYTEALQVFKRLMADYSQVQPNVATIISTMSVCGNLGSVDQTRSMHALLEKAGWLKLDVSIANSLIDSYAKCGNLCHAKRVFDDIEDAKKDLFSWTTIISGFAMHGQGLDTLNLFSQMEQRCELKPDAITFVSVLSACAHSGLIEEGKRIFESMRTKYKIEPDLRHYGCIVDLLGRAGMVERAYNLVENMPMEPNLAILGALLSGCRLHNKLEFGEAVLRKIEFLKERGGARVLLSNMYADGNQWNKVINIRKEMRVTDQGKMPGRSWIQIKDGVYEFVAGNEIDSQAVELHMVLEGLEKVSRL